MSFKPGKQMSIGESLFLFGYGFIWLVGATKLAVGAAIEKILRSWQFGVHKVTIGKIHRRKRWAHLEL